MTAELATRTARPDPAAAAAVDVAREAAEAEARDPALVGPHLGVSAEGERLVLHRFACLDPAYPGWHWAVELTRASRARVATVNDAVLLPGDTALLSPPWVPWSERLRPGDVGVGDLLPTAADDPRLSLRVSDTDGWADTDLWLELGLGRPRVLSAVGRDDAADRWYSGEPGPDSAVAQDAPARCSGCGFFVRLVGALGRLFGVCSNEMSPGDAQVVSVDHGCGAHSEALVLPSAHPAAVPYDDSRVEDVSAAGHGPGSVDDNPETGEPYGHG